MTSAREGSILTLQKTGTRERGDSGLLSQDLSEKNGILNTGADVTNVCQLRPLLRVERASSVTSQIPAPHSWHLWQALGLVPQLPASGAVFPAPEPWAPIPLLASSVLLTILLKFLWKPSLGPHFPAISQCAVTLCLIGKRAGRQSHPQLGAGNCSHHRVACSSETFETSLGHSLPGMIKAGVEEEGAFTLGRPSRGRFAKSWLFFSQNLYLQT